MLIVPRSGNGILFIFEIAACKVYGKVPRREEKGELRTTEQACLSNRTKLAKVGTNNKVLFRQTLAISVKIKSLIQLKIFKDVKLIFNHYFQDVPSLFS